ncbi:unnamed protein product [Parnassius apollo]|uniref:(apollo) hypothetical protein n=1 Tax=Parnassius apollo TaxID=110799 RepID=A0A8S3WQN0_PARAO|nr:unnamed protein product [Parnassius apollo]
MTIEPDKIYYFLFTDSELEELGEQMPRYRPDSIAALRRATRFTEPELKRLYRGFKAECPTGVVREDTFKHIYAQFFPQGGFQITRNYSIVADIKDKVT